MIDFEGLGVFYLGKRFEPARAAPLDEPILYDAKDLTTHAVCMGMTGSGKTGLCVTLLEEAAIDGIPAIAIDPKGDLANLLLAFPDLRPADFRPWVDEGAAARAGLDADAFARRAADTWCEGLAAWGQDGGRVRRYRDAVDAAVYTPGSTAGRPLQVLRTLAAPEAGLRADGTALRERILTAVSGLLGLLGINADPIRSREHILLSNLLDRAWREGRDLDLPRLIREIQAPPFDRVGVFELEDFYPAARRLELAMLLNNLLASPGFSAWMEGEPLDVQRLLYTPEGRPRLSILSIAHLSEAERMFFVTLLLNEVVAWMRAQTGTSSLRAILYMDEIFGYFPPTANPPSKPPMLTLLKQARAYGLGIVLATQNPVDLDYKGLANTGTWLLGRLQTERDKNRVLEGLEGVLSDGGGFDRAAMDRLLSGLGKRVFLMRNVHDDAPVVMQTRWALSYLRGPMTLAQIRSLSAARPGPDSPAPAAAPAPAPGAVPAEAEAPPAERPVAPPAVAQFFRPPARPAPAGGPILYRPAVAGWARLHFVHAKSKTDCWRHVGVLAPPPPGAELDWAAGERVDGLRDALEKDAREPARYASLPDGLARPRNWTRWEKEFRGHLYERVTLDLWLCPALPLMSEPGEEEGAFRVRAGQAVRERRDGEIEELRAKYGARLATLQDRIRRAEQKIEKEKGQVGQQMMQTAIAFGATLLGALVGRRGMSRGTVSRAATTMRSAGRIAREKGDVAHAEESLEALRDRRKAMERDTEEETERIRAAWQGVETGLEPLRIRPRKSDISVGGVALVWTPWGVAPDGIPESLA